MVKKNEITIKKSLATLGQLQNTPSINFLHTDTQDSLKRLVKALSPPWAIEAERNRQSLLGGVDSKARRDNLLKALGFIDNKEKEAAFRKNLFPNPRAFLEEERLRFAASWAETKKSIEELDNDSERAKKLLRFADEFQDISIPDGLKIIEDELRENGALTSRQLLFLIAESLDIDTSSMAKVLGTNGGKGKAGHKCELYYAVQEVTKIVNACSYSKVARHLNNSTNQTIKGVVVIKSNLPTKTGLDGILEYETSDGKLKSIKSSGIAAHIRAIKNYNK
jgi:hypothetical protein